MIKFFIDSREVTAKEGETILQVARREGVYIPTMCYISKIRPIASCRLCVVEVEGSNGFVLSCQTPAKEGIKVTTNSDKLFKHRQNIMKLYNVNHPLQCGVCDKSGECQLQNKTLEFSVSEQDFSAIEHKRTLKKWGALSYDPYLCIMCEKCVSVCNEIVGTQALHISRSGYSSEINIKMTKCVQCGECISVCPVGALVSTDFKYSSNAWELSKVDSSCSYCSSGCALQYELKQDKIYRVTNDEEFNSLCGAGRFVYETENRVLSKDEEAFSETIEAFKRAKTIKFSSYITNEEASILQRLKRHLGYKLINSEARKFKEFLSAYSEVTAKALYSGSLDSVRDGDFNIVIGSRVTTDNPILKYALNQAFKRHNAKTVYMHPIEDISLNNIITQFIKYEVGSEEGVVALLVSELLDRESIPEELAKYISELDIGYLCAESSVGEEELSKISRDIVRAKNINLIVGEDLINHKNAKNIAKLLAMFEKYAGFNVLVVPAKTNSLGVSLICDLDEESEGYSIGYNRDADFVIGSIKEATLDMPNFSQQEGTFVNIDKRVVSLNSALDYCGYTLNDIAKELIAFDARDELFEYTSHLPELSGFRAVEFDDLNSGVDSSGCDNRGYILDRVALESCDETVSEPEELPEFNGTVLYHCNPINQFSLFTNLSNSKAIVYGSPQFSQVAKVSDGDTVSLDIDGRVLCRTFKIDKNLKGTIALNPIFDLNLSDDLLSSYRFAKTKITKVEE
jgi:NADH-quinone oxidoreductase subunit G